MELGEKFKIMKEVFEKIYIEEFYYLYWIPNLTRLTNKDE
jgi:hypothetical protein